jgi:hypothetical protein
MTSTGFVRVPARISLGKSQHVDRGVKRGTKVHTPPLIPDDNYNDWRYLNNMYTPWAELRLSYGNDTAYATMAFAAFDITDASYRNLQAQLGINTAFVTLRFPEAFGTRGGFSLDVGALSNRYGTAGRSNAGMYQTYLFGRTRVAGETLTATVGLTRALELVLEHGVGAKLDVIPYATGGELSDADQYPGPVPQGSTFLHHAHALLDFHKKLEVGVHYLTTWSADDRTTPGIDGVVAPSRPGRMTVYGAELRLTGGVFGDGYLGFSRITARNILSLADAIEVLHSQGGWQFRNNYFGAYDRREARPEAGDPNGTVDTLLAQYELSLGKILRHPQRFWGNGPDLTLGVFGMFNTVDHEQNSVKKLKWGTELLYKPIKVLAVGGRYDMVQPDLNSARKSFRALTAELILRTDFTGHERVVFKYTRYSYGSQVWPSFPYDQIEQLDRNVFSLSANMWW